jgi:hypothetical protein
MGFEIETVGDEAHVKCRGLKRIEFFQCSPLHQFGHRPLKRHLQNGMGAERDKQGGIFGIDQ